MAKAKKKTKRVALKRKKTTRPKEDPCACPYEGAGVPVGVRCNCLNCRGADM